MRLAIAIAAGALCLGAAGSCNGTKPGPSPVPTIATVIIGPVHQEAGTECGQACQAQHDQGCPNGAAPKSVEHCVGLCTAGRQQLTDPSAKCLALVFTCDTKCKP